MTGSGGGAAAIVSSLEYLSFARAGVPVVQAEEAKVPGIEIVPLATLREAIDALLGARAERPPLAGAKPERDERAMSASGQAGKARGTGGDGR